MPRSDAQTLSDANNTALNPSQNVAGAGGGRFTVTILAERPMDAEDILTALRTAFGATKVTADNDVMARNTLNLRIAA